MTTTGKPAAPAYFCEYGPPPPGALDAAGQASLEFSERAWVEADGLGLEAFAAREWRRRPGGGALRIRAEEEKGPLCLVARALLEGGRGRADVFLDYRAPPPGRPEGPAFRVLPC
jgi:hypothetical protein